MAKKINIIAIVVLFIMGLAKPLTASPLEIVPFDSANQSPLQSIYGLPGAGNFQLLAPGRTEVGLNVALSSNYAVDDNVREQVILDGETTRFTFRARYGLFPRLEIGVKAPYIIQGGGFLDGFIESYHSVFGFPQGGRDQAPRNRLFYIYRKDGVERLILDKSGAGLGDLQLTTAYQFYEKREQQGLVLNFGIKLPAGDSDQWRGSGSTDLSLWITGGADLGQAGGRWASYGSAGMLFMSEGDILPDQQKKAVAFGSLGLGWVPLPWLALKVQADAHTPFFSYSDLVELSGNAAQLIMGGTIVLSQRMRLDIGVSEDLVVATSPDVVFYLNLRRQF